MICVVKVELRLLLDRVSKKVLHKGQKLTIVEILNAKLKDQIKLLITVKCKIFKVKHFESHPVVCLRQINSYKFVRRFKNFRNGQVIRVLGVVTKFAL